MSVTEFFTYLLEHEASRGLAVDLADTYVERLQREMARVATAAAPMARAS